MVCIKCGKNTRVTNSRHQARSNLVWRRRQCMNCGIIFTTNEKVSYEGSWTVLNKSGAYEPFSSDKLMIGLYSCCRHRKTALVDARSLTDTITTALHTSVIDSVIPSSAIKHKIEVALNRFDKTARAVYMAQHTS